MRNFVPLFFAFFFSVVSFAQDGPDLGVAATPEQIAGWDTVIDPLGENLPVGNGTVAEGKAIYAIQCASCHGANGEGATNDRLSGGHGTLGTGGPLSAGKVVRTIGSFWPYATTVFDYVRRAMPFTNPGSLSNDEVYSLTAFLLHINNVIDASDVMNAETLPAVVMPNQKGFESAFDSSN